MCLRLQHKAGAILKGIAHALDLNGAHVVALDVEVAKRGDLGKRDEVIGAGKGVLSQVDGLLEYEGVCGVGVHKAVR